MLGMEIEYVLEEGWENGEELSGTDPPKMGTLSTRTWLSTSMGTSTI